MKVEGLDSGLALKGVSGSLSAKKILLQGAAVVTAV
jgi:hypothetical protein